MKPLFSKILYMMEKGMDTVLVTIVNADGSVPRSIGSMMLVGTSGRLYGSIGGGAVEKIGTDHALTLLAQRRSDLRHFNLHPGGEADIGMICGGDVTVLFQLVPGKDEAWQSLCRTVLERLALQAPTALTLYYDGRLPSLTDDCGSLLFGSPIPVADVGRYCHPFRLRHRALIFGAGHIARALCPLLRSLDFAPVIYDDRAEYAARAHFPTAEQVICGDFREIEKHLRLHREDFVVIMTSGHSHDFAVERQIHSGDVAYIGVIGSRSKRAAVAARLEAMGIPREKLEAVHSPVGTAIRAVTPEEIAVSIAGEMILLRAALRDGAADESTHRVCPV